MATKKTASTPTKATKTKVVAALPVPFANQATLPSDPLKDSHPRQVLGDSGTRTIHGIISEEYNPNLQGIQGIRVYDEMRKSDGTCRAAMLVTTLPIRRAKWFVNPATSGDSPEDVQNQEIANFVEHALFDWIEGMSWDDIIRQALLMIPFGVMLFEKVYGVKEHDGKQYVTLEKLAPRLPKSIQQWELIDGTFGIQQIRQDGQVAQIAGSKLLIFCNEREGDNWWGTSMLRAAYKHWYMKNTFYKIDAIAFERQGLGVPTMKMPQGYTESDEKKATQIMQNLRASENAFLILPTGYEFEFADMGAKNTRDPENSINHHNKEILQSVLAQFLELGATRSGGGSRALSQDHSDLFLKAMEAIANTARDVFNQQLIKELVDLNFNDVKVYPVLDYSGITKVDITAFGTSYAALVTAGAISPTDDDEQYVRAAMGLPPRSQEDIDAAADDEPSAQEQEDEADIVDDGEAAPVGSPQEEEEDTEAEDEGTVSTAAKKSAKPAQSKGQKARTDKAAKRAKKPSKASEHNHRLPRTFDDGKGFSSWRPMVMSEKKVDWTGAQAELDQLQSDFTKDATELLNASKDSFMKKLHQAIVDGDAKAIADLSIAFVSQYKALLKDSMKDAYEYGKNAAAKEMGIQVPPTNADSLSHRDALADTIAQKTATDIETKAKLSAVNALKQDTSPLQASGTIDAALEELINKSVANTASMIMGQGMNNGRNDVFARNHDMIYALQRSELLDQKTCNFCLSIDGLVIEPSDPWASTDVFHSNCRGLWVEIMNDELNPPPVTGIPSEVGDYYGGEPNSLIQPPKPIVRPGSAAAKALAKLDAAKEAKKK